MKLLRICLILFPVLFLSSCKKDGLLIDGQVTAVIRDGNLKINNGTLTRIYFMLLESSCAETIYWGPLTEGNTNFIESGSFRLRSLSDITSCQTRSRVKKGETIYVYWWREDVVRTNAIRQITVDI